MWIDREISRKIIDLSRSFPALILTGARQTGKTSLLRRLFPEYHYVSLDLRVIAEQAEESPESFLRDHPPPVVIDEVQYAPGLFRHLKVAIDRERQKKGRFILTGSQKFTLMKEISDSLAGRCALLSLPGLTMREIKVTGWRSDDVGSHSALLVRGNFPELWAEPTIPGREFYQAYVATYLERDLRQVINVGNLRDFERFIRACAARSSQLLNKSELARDVGISQTTAGEWISALEASNQITLLEPFFANVGKRLVKSPKLYFNDTGLLCFLLGLSPEALGTSPLTGAVWENFVLSELAKWVALYRPEWTLWFYRDQQNHEADFLLQGPFEHVYVMDAKWAEMPKSDSFAPLQQVATLVARARDIKHVDLALVSRAGGTTQLGEDQSLVSGFEIAQYLERQ
jgi:hypothetical protein